MFSHNIKQYIRRPYVHLAEDRDGRMKVRMHIRGVGAFDLHPEEAIGIANKLVDRAEEITSED